MRRRELWLRVCTARPLGMGLSLFLTLLYQPSRHTDPWSKRTNHIKTITKN
jgi:hypothetical protein